MDRDIYVPPGGPPQGSPPPRVYDDMGQENIFKLLEDFYLALGDSQIKHLFPKSKEGLIKNSQKSAAFFVGLFGGPPLYHQTYGPPRMRMRHMPFVIDEAGRKEWVAMFRKTLSEPQKYQFPEEALPSFFEFLEGFSGWMVNSK